MRTAAADMPGDDNEFISAHRTRANVIQVETIEAQVISSSVLRVESVSQEDIAVNAVSVSEIRAGGR